MNLVCSQRFWRIYMHGHFLNQTTSASVRRPSRGGKTLDSLLTGRIWVLALLALGHAALGLVIKLSPWVVTVHAFSTLAFSLVWGTRPGKPARTLLALCYIAGSEVLWRMVDTPPFLTWMFGKQAFILVILCAFVRRRRFSQARLPLAYFLLLLPALIPTLASVDLHYIPTIISTGYTCLLAIALSLTFFADTKLSRDQVLNALCITVLPIIGVAYICYTSTFGAPQIDFESSSNVDASGGFGPNQVSAMLGFGSVCAFLCLLLGRTGLLVKAGLAMLAAWFAMQSALTFSRTGLYLSVMSCLVAGLPLLRRWRTGFMVIGVVLGFYLLSSYLLFPYLDQFTGGKLTARFENTVGTGREEIVKSDFQIWAKHLLLGVGIGKAYSARREFLGHAAYPHTEYTRLVAEHGVFGILAGCILFWILIRACLSAPDPASRSIKWGAFIFGLLFMSVSATRLVVPALAFGVVAASIIPQQRFARRNRPASPQPEGSMRMAGLRFMRRTGLALGRTAVPKPSKMTAP